MFALNTRRVRTAFIGATVLLSICAQALPAAAASEKANTFDFTIVATHDVTTFLDSCPAGTPPPYVQCGFGMNEKVDSVTNTGKDLGLSTANGQVVTESFVSALAMPAMNARTSCWAMADWSAVTVHTTRGDLYLVTQDGSYCLTNYTDVEPFSIVGGTGDYRGATGSGKVVAHPTGQSAPGVKPVQGYASEQYDGTITVAGR